MLTLYADCLLPVEQNGVLVKHLEGTLTRFFDTKCVGGVLWVFGMTETPRDLEKRTLTISHEQCTILVLEKCGMRGVSTAHKIGVSPRLSIDRGKGNLLTKADTRRYQQTSARSKRSKAYTWRKPRIYSAMSLVASISTSPMSKEVLTRQPSQVPTWGNNPDNAKST